MTCSSPGISRLLASGSKKMRGLQIENLANGGSPVHGCRETRCQGAEMVLTHLHLSQSSLPLPKQTHTMTSTIQQTYSTDTHSIYTVYINNRSIITTVTNVASVVESWLHEIYNIHGTHLIVGLDVEWRPTFQRNVTSKVALLQLCVGSRCLIFQLIHANRIPRSLRDFLADGSFGFVGVGIKNDVEKLEDDYDLTVGCAVDLRSMAATKFHSNELRSAGLTNLASYILDLDVVKPSQITLSNWESSWLTINQVKYACVDAYLSFEIGKYLIQMN
ncbi:3'-5' exonuclease-like [Magnolia sinica]|uniref:3'-5' exonuclease-like n=1 Tax=Magnolia sinica TaxID=86752 RepID=UPI002657DD28|nr:3'-5' exonuclease-like [Magnolia sinica]